LPDLPRRSIGLRGGLVERRQLVKARHRADQLDGQVAQQLRKTGPASVSSTLSPFTTRCCEKAAEWNSRRQTAGVCH